MKPMSDVENNEDDSAGPMPPASLSEIAWSLRTQADLFLGLLQFGEEEKPKADLPRARHMIDLMAVLLEKTKGNLTLEEQRFIENSLTELRFRFVQVSDDLAKPKPAESQNA
jgi:hypothetical protein